MSPGRGGERGEGGEAPRVKHITRRRKNADAVLRAVGIIPSRDQVQGCIVDSSFSQFQHLDARYGERKRFPALELLLLQAASFEMDSKVDVEVGTARERQGLDGSRVDSAVVHA